MPGPINTLLWVVVAVFVVFVALALLRYIGLVI